MNTGMTMSGSMRYLFIALSYSSQSRLTASGVSKGSSGRNRTIFVSSFVMASISLRESLNLPPKRSSENL